MRYFIIAAAFITAALFTQTTHAVENCKSNGFSEQYCVAELD